MMNRRDALKGLSLGIGYVVATPLVMEVLKSCKEEGPSWVSLFFDPAEQHTVTHLVDIILPPSEIPGGLDLNLPQFIDKMCGEVLGEEHKELFHRGSAVFGNRFSSQLGKDIKKADKAEVLQVFSSYFDLSEEATGRILQEQRKPADEIPADRQEDYAMYKYLFTVRSFSLLGYYSSEKIGKEVLVFDPIPGAYKPCIPLEEVGNAWAI